MSQFCSHSVSVGVAVYGTNAFGQLISGRAHPGDTVFVHIRVIMADDCGGDQTLVTNVIDSVDAQCVSFTTNLIRDPLLLSFFGQYQTISNVPSGAAYTYVVPDCGSNSVVIHETKAFALDTNSAVNPNGPLYAGTSAQLQIYRSKLTISERRYSLAGENGLQWEATVNNAGNTSLTNVTVRYVANGTTNFVWGLSDLAPGEGTIIRIAPAAYDCAEDFGILIGEGTDPSFHRARSTNGTALLPSLLSIQSHRQPDLDSAILIRWPGRFSCFSLESAATLSSLDWSPIHAIPLMTNGEVIMTLPATNRSGFFRLIRR